MKVRSWPAALDGVRATLQPLKKAWISASLGLLAQASAHPIGREQPVKLRDQRAGTVEQRPTTSSSRQSPADH